MPHPRSPADPSRARDAGAPAWLVHGVLLAVVLLLVSGCRAAAPEDAQGLTEQVAVPEADPGDGEPASSAPDPAPEEAVDPDEGDAEAGAGAAVRTGPEPRVSYVSVPRLGMADMPLERYRGTPDDAPGTEIQNTGVMASPRGTAGLVGPGEIGNFLITGHRSSHGAPLLDLPDLQDGDAIRVRTGDQVFVYRVTDTRITSFRSSRSLREQSAAVPGRPGAEATRAMLTLSTCRTPEDRAEGNYWSDEFGNPENRIDKVAVLERVRPA